MTLNSLAEETLRRREAILEAVGFAAETFLGSSPWESSIGDVLSRLGQATSVDRVYIFTNQQQLEKPIRSSLSYEWVASGIESLLTRPDLQNMENPSAGFGDWFSRLSAGQAIQGRSRDFPADVRDYLLGLGAASVLTMPLFVGTTWWGSIGFHDCFQDRRWSASEVEALHVLTNTLGAAIQRQEAEVALRQTQKLESVGILARGIAHDFNNLLTGVLGQTSLALALLPVDSAAARHVEKAMVSAEKATDLTRQLLAYAGSGQHQIMSLSLNDIIGSSLGLLQTVLPKQARLRLDLASTLPAVEVEQGQMQQLVMNLVMNAAESLQGQAGTVTIGTAVVNLRPGEDQPVFVMGDRLDPGSYVRLNVTDTGMGIEPYLLAKIFDPFFTTNAAGRGLGLSATLGIVRTHHGALQVQSRPEMGSTFTVYLPLPNSLPDRSSKLALPNSLDKDIILVIDDEEPVREAVHDILEMADLVVISAATGPEGIDLFQRRRSEIALVLLDMRMPVMSGQETLLHLRAIDPQIKVIVSSGYSEPELSRRFDQQSPTAYLHKPYDFDELVHIIQQTLG